MNILKMGSEWFHVNHRLLAFIPIVYCMGQGTGMSMRSIPKYNWDQQQLTALIQALLNVITHELIW